METGQAFLRVARAALTACLAVSLAAGSPALALAQTYPQLHVAALSQRTDRVSVEPGGVFHLTIHVRVTQHRERLDELILGTFENCEIISNETVRTAMPAGTDFVERLAVQALQPGVATISPAYIDAIDPGLGKPMRFSSNAVRVSVGSGNRLGGALNGLADKARRLLLAAAIVAGFFAAAFVVFAVFVRRRKPMSVPTAPPPAIPAAPVPPAPPLDRLAQAADVYRRTRTQGPLMEVRAALFELAGAAAGATLVDALGALGARDGALRACLIAAEGAAFGPEAVRATAGDELLTAIAVYRPHGAAKADAWTP